MIRRAIVLVVSLLILAAAGYGAQRLTRFSWDAVVQYNSPFAVPLPSAPAGPPLVRRVVLVVVDGLRLDVSQRMPTLNALRQQGADFVAWTGEPSLSFPGWTVIASGATQEVSGVTTNWYEGRVKVDHLFAAAHRLGLRTAVAGSTGWGELFGDAVDDSVLVEDPPGYTDVEAMYATSDRVARGALGFLKDDQARFVLVHFPSPDLLGHGFGGASAEYAEAARRVDAHLASLRDATGSSAVLIVTADHGHIDSGGHGGWEPVVKRVPLVLWGPGVRSGVHGGDVRQADIAPTVAVLLGIPVPSQSQGRPLVEAMGDRARQSAPRWAVQQRAFYQHAGTVLPAPALDALFTDARLAAMNGNPNGIAALSEEITRTFARARTAQLWRERTRRLPVAVVLALLPAVYFARQRRRLGLALLGTVVFFVVDYGLFYGRGYHFSLSVFNSESMILRFFNSRLLDAALAIAAAGLVVGVLSARRSAGDTAQLALLTGLLVGYAILLQVLYFYWLWDIRFAWYLPDLRLGFKYYLDLLMLVPVGYLALGYTLVALLSRAVARRLWTPRPGTT